MMRKWNLFCVGTAVYVLSLGQIVAEEFEFTSVEGKPIAPLQSIDGKPVVLIFIATDCPVANGYVPEINRIYEKYSSLGVRFTLAHPEPSVTPDNAKIHAEEYALKPPVVIDADHQLVRAAGATTTPEVAVFDGAGTLAYLGRINNRYSDYGDRRPKASEHNLRNALDALLSGQKVAVAKAPALGCLIEPLPVAEE